MLIYLSLLSGNLPKQSNVNNKHEFSEMIFFGYSDVEEGNTVSFYFLPNYDAVQERTTVS